MTERYNHMIYRRISPWRLFIALFAVLLSASFSSCIDEIEYPDGEIPDGETTVMTEVRFTPLVEAELDGASSRSNGLEFGQGNTSAPTGDRMDAITSLYLLFYTTAGDLIPDLSFTVDLEQYKPVLEPRVDENASNGVSAQDATYCVKLPLTLPNGVYKIFAVANMPGLLTDSQYAEAIKTIGGLRSIKLSWVPNDISKNSEMLGYFTNEKQDTRGMNFENEGTVTVSPRNTTLHAWIRRAVSKLTIDFDGSNLRDNVFVYIKEARVYDIADGCYLGYYSCVGDPSKEADIQAKGGFGLAKSSHVLMYGSGEDADYEKWPVVTRGQNLDSYKGLDGKEVKFHDEKAYCLPFYENIQGNGDLKYQDGDGDGMVDHPTAGDHTGEGADRVWTHEKAKDSKPNGTYVEVIGHYESRNKDYASGGEIKFRFMLGKDVKRNFDVERNHHYKLTLSFKGNGNDADWHIEYDETPGIHLPSPLYISYLYNKSLTFPIRINTGGKTLKSVKIDITRNNWAPYFEDGHDISEDLDYFADADKESGYGTKNPEYGFLSLLKTSQKTIEGVSVSEHYNQKYTDEGGLEVSRGLREYLVDAGEHGNEDLGKYVVRHNGNIVEMEIPLYTRAKNLVKTSAYTGNNPYVGYPRLAEITVTATYTDDSKTIIPNIPVYQVRRLVNPKGIFRKAGNNTSFHVKLLEKEHEASTKFQELSSIGPWRAYVLTEDGDFINLDGKKEVSGTTSTAVDFNVNFVGSTDKDKNRFAIIQVEYHNLSCIHQIFVRQGDAPVQLFDEKTNGKSVYWHTYNMLLKNKEVTSPLDEGSMFKWANWDQPIDASNNKNTKPDWVKVTPEDFGPVGDLRLATTGNAVPWSTITSGTAYEGKFDDQKDSEGNVYSLPTFMEFIYLRNNTEQAFGVLYGDEAEGVSTTLASAYGYQRDDKGNVNGSYGMRGCFAYVGNASSSHYGKHVFLPVGASGYGKRKNSDYHGGKWGDPETYAGQLRYAAGRTKHYMPSNKLALPLFYDLYMRAGAIYWTQGIYNYKGDENLGYKDYSLGGGDYSALDINYFSFDFNGIDHGTLFGVKDTSKYPNTNILKEDTTNKSDACLIRCVDRK